MATATNGTNIGANTLHDYRVGPGGRVRNWISRDPQLTDAANGDFTPQAAGLPAGVGLERDPTCQNYTPIPATLAAAESWILGA